MNIKILNLILVVIVAICGHSAQGAGPQFLGLLQDYYAAPADSSSRHSAIATMDLDEAIGEVLPLAGERWSDVVRTETGDYFAIEGDSAGNIYHINPNTMQPLRLAISGPGIPPSPWLGGLTWDSTRDRLVVASLGDGGYLFEYVPATSVWNLISSLNQSEVRSIAYRQSNDMLYGLQHFGGPTSVLYRFGGGGTLLGTVNLSEPIGADTPSGLDWQMMFASDGRLAVIGTEWVNDALGNHIGIDSRIYLIDPDTGLVNGQVPEPGMLGVALAGLGLLLRRGVRVR
jgi:hypothetical protein